MGMKIVVALAGAALASLSNGCWAYGQEGHSIVAEIAQRRLEPAAQAAVNTLLGASMASVASWADDVKFPGTPHPESYNWHFVDIPLLDDTYQPERDCKQTAKGDCIVAELDRLRTQLACAPTADQRREALKFAIHFLGDIHQPLHTVLEKIGANAQKVSGVIHGTACSAAGCEFDSTKDSSVNLHFLWDTGLIRATVYDWGAYVDKLDGPKGILKTDAGLLQRGKSLDPMQWALETHLVAQQVWPVKVPSDPSNAVFTVDDAYYAKVLPLLDQELAVAGLRLAGFLNEAYSGAACAVAPKSNLGDLKAELADYYTQPVESGSTRYELAQAEVGREAAQYLVARVAEHQVAKPALVLDIDETSLNNLEQMRLNDFGYIALGPCTLKASYACSAEDWDKSMRATAIKSTLALYRTAMAQGVAVFFVTGRRDAGAERSNTVLNLKKVGYTGYKALYLRPQGTAGGASVSEYKSTTRAAIEADGYHIIANVGDQPSDLAGGHADRGFLMPNPAYRIP